MSRVQYHKPLRERRSHERGPSSAPTASASVSWNRLAQAPSSWMRSATWPPPLRRNCYACCRNSASSASAGTSHSRPTS